MYLRHGKVIAPRSILCVFVNPHYSDVIMSTMVSQITGVSIVYWTVCSGTEKKKHQSSASLAFVGGIHRWPGNYPHNGPLTRKMFHLMTSSCHKGSMILKAFPYHDTINVQARKTFDKLISNQKRDMLTNQEFTCFLLFFFQIKLYALWDHEICYKLHEIHPFGYDVTKCNRYHGYRCRPGGGSNLHCVRK